MSGVRPSQVNGISYQKQYKLYVTYRRIIYEMIQVTNKYTPLAYTGYRKYPFDRASKRIYRQFVEYARNEL